MRVIRVSSVQTTRTASRGSLEHPEKPDHGNGSYPSRGLVGAAPRRRRTQYARQRPSAGRPDTRIPGRLGSGAGVGRGGGGRFKKRLFDWVPGRVVKPPTKEPAG